MRFTFILICLTHLVSCYKYDEQKYNNIGNNVIVSNFKVCAKIGYDIIKKGNGFDASIAVMLCEGLGKPQDMGLGGGFFGIVKLLKKNSTFVINSREKGPLDINSLTFDLHSSNKIFGKVVSVPSALKGYRLLHIKYGKLEWKQIVMPVAKLAKKGFPCTYRYSLE